MYWTNPIYKRRLKLHYPDYIYRALLVEPSQRNWFEGQTYISRLKEYLDTDQLGS